MPFKVIKENILKENNEVADTIRDAVNKENIYMINIISSPGAGKTTFLEKVGPMLKDKGIKFMILAGDCFTTKDAERMDALDLPVVQINTGNSCHIDAQLVKKALEGVDLTGLDLIIVENVGNLVCPAEFDIGEHMKIALLSTAEGHDKPAKYPLLIEESGLTIINKTDLLEYVDFDMGYCTGSILDIRPDMEILKMSCKTGDGVNKFIDWIINKIEVNKEIKA